MDANRLLATANFLACAVLVGLGAAAIALAILLGPFGLVLLGLLTLMVCTAFSLDEHAPTWSARVFSAQMTQTCSPEQRAAAADARRVGLAPARLYRWFGVVLLGAGCIGIAWQRWG